jgi:hypothetical protein
MRSQKESRRLGPAIKGVAAAAVVASLTFGGAALADPLSSPSMTPPLTANANPFSVDSGTPLGKIYIGGALTGIALTQTHRTPADTSSLFDLTNAQVIVQSTSGPIQFYIQAGTYSQPYLAVPYSPNEKSTKAPSNNFGAVPVAYLKFQATPELSFTAGKLPTLIGDEYTFTFQNMNVFRGLLVFQEPAISRGFQATYAKGPLTFAVSWNDGYYSNKLNWITSAITYALDSKNTFVVSGGSALSKSGKSSFATYPPLNNGWIIDAIWTHTDGPLMISPYFQYTKTYAHEDLGFPSGYTIGGAILAKYSVTKTISLAGRVEYEKTHTDACSATAIACTPNAYLFGDSSKAWSFTFTPTWQKGIFFLRAEGSYVHGSGIPPGSGFGEDGTAKDQFRAVAETGIIF